MSGKYPKTTPRDNSAAMIAFRRATPQDKSFLLMLRKASMAKHLKNAGLEYDDAAHLQRVETYFTDAFIISYQQRTIGLIKLGQFAESFHIRQLQILPRFQGLGIGSQVLTLLKRKAQTKRIAITLNVLLNNPAKHLYLRHGFVIISSNALEHQMRWQG
ncbi:GNAT family N-acetyltransferase [Colwellia chukchiensis]|nr:GNAT family N-acetyltransferase [Colwellia chukchiensis]